MTHVFLERNVRIDGVDTPGLRVHSHIEDGTIDSLINSGWARLPTAAELARSTKQQHDDDRDADDRDADLVPRTDDDDETPSTKPVKPKTPRKR